MAVTGRDLHKQPTRKPMPAAAPVRLPQVELNRQYIQWGILIVLGFIVLQLLLVRGQTWFDDLRYGRPRTMQLSAYVGHNEQTGQPSHFVAMNLNRRVIVIELPGGDSAKAQTLQGPYLFGANEDLTPVTLRVNDLNGDQKGDLVIAVKNEEIIYINTGDTFRLITDDERRQMTEASQ